MASSLALLLGVLVGLVLGGAIGWFASRSGTVTPGADGTAAHEAALRQLAAEHAAELRSAQQTAEHETAVREARHAAELAAVRHEAESGAAAQRHDAEVARARLEQTLTEARAEVESRLAASLAEVRELRGQVDTAARQYADLVERHRREAEERQVAARSESKVLQQLAPVAAQLKGMQAKVEEIEKQRSGQHSALSEQLRVSQETAERSKLAAEQLASALRNNSVRGVYGEMQLTSIVESAGLINRVDFTTQASIEADSGARRPDMVVRLPGRKQMAVDAKVPFSAFIDANDTTRGERERKSLAQQHARQVRAHVDALSAKEYWTGLESSPEFTVAFIPNDAILNVALDADPHLMEHAFSKGIVLATPVNLWAVLKTVAFTWKQEDLAENAAELVELGRTLYKRLSTLSEHVSKLGRSLERTVGDYNKFVGSLERGVLVTARRLDAVDDAVLLEPVKQLDADPRGLTAAELVDAEVVEDAEPVEVEPVELEPVELESAGRPRPGRRSPQPADEGLFDDLERPELDFTAVADAEAHEGRDAG